MQSRFFLPMQHQNRCSIVTFSYCLNLSFFSDFVSLSHSPSPPLCPVSLLFSCKPLMVISCSMLNVSLCLHSPRSTITELSPALLTDSPQMNDFGYSIGMWTKDTRQQCTVLVWLRWLLLPMMDLYVMSIRLENICCLS